MTLLLILLFTFLGSVFSVGLAGLMLLLKENHLRSVTGALIPFAIGTLLGAAFFGMIPHALSKMASSSALPLVLCGIVLFYVMEKFTVWRHCHEQPCAVHTRAGAMILVGDAIHNFVDGVTIAAAFASSLPLGITTSLAVIAHELPQEVGDFAILLESGYSPKRALGYNVLSSLAAVPGALLTWWLLPFIRSLVPGLLAVSAASFVYIALADLVPGRRATGGLRSLLWELPLISMGVGAIILFQRISGH